MHALRLQPMEDRQPAERVRELWAWRPGWYHPQDDERDPTSNRSGDGAVTCFFGGGRFASDPVSASCMPGLCHLWRIMLLHRLAHCPAQLSSLVDWSRRSDGHLSPRLSELTAPPRRRTADEERLGECH